MSVVTSTTATSAPYRSWLEHAVGQTDAGEDQADLAAGQHPEPDHEPVADAAEQPEPGDELADAGHDARARAMSARRLGSRERAEVGVDADLQEEHGDEQVADRRELPAHALGRRGAAQRDAGGERTDDRGELGGVGERARTPA